MSLSLRALRGFLAGGLLLLCQPLAAQYEPLSSGIDHASLHVADVDASLAFYSALFGSTPVNQSGLALGNSHLDFTAARDSAFDHVAFAVDNFDRDRLAAYLERQQLPLTLTTPAAGAAQAGDKPESLRVTDTDRITSVLVPARREDDGDSRQAATTGIFRPLMIDEVHITVSNMEVDSLFYSRLLGRSGTLQAGSLWFDIGHARLRISQAPVGHRTGINYLSVLVANTDMDAAMEAVFQTGGLIENILPNGFSFWDPDGLRLLVRSTSML